MNNALREIETEDVVIYRSQVYSISTLEKCRCLHGKLVKEGKMAGTFSGDLWTGYSGVKHFEIDFTLDAASYRDHAGKEFGISLETMKNMLRCYAVYCTGVYVYKTISREKLGTIKKFLQCFGDKGFSLPVHGITTIGDFLAFIGTADRQIWDILSRIKRVQDVRSGQRTLSPIINYLAIENEINSIYRNSPDEMTFRRWFPVFFWVNITFILPLRATEMLVTPKKCIHRTDDGRTLLTVRRTKLKKGRRTVYYDVEKDYREFSYEIPNSSVAATIEKYLELTSGQDRRFLFEFNALMINEMLSLSAFNHLLSEFMEERLIGNPRYDFARYAAGINEFEIVTAGDSRPIALANLYFQNAGEDICRQLADHVHINTSAGYYTNISETIWASSVIHMQKRMDYECRQSEEMYRRGELAVSETGLYCMSAKRLADEEDISDCIAEGHLSDCMGCRYYRPSKKELSDFLELQKKRADEGAKRVIEFMNDIMKEKKQGKTMEELFLAAQTDAGRYRMGCDISAKEKYEEWQEHRNTQRNCF